MGLISIAGANHRRYAILTGGGPGPSGDYYAGPVLGSLTPTMYAAPTAQGTGSGTSEANARTLASALAAATAGTIIGVLPGVYTGTGQSNKITPAWRINASGTSDNPIIVVAKYSAIDLAGKVAADRWTLAEVDAVLAHANRTEFRHTGVTDGDGQGSACPSWGVNGPYAWQYWIGMCCDQLYNEIHEDGGVTNLWGATHSKIMRAVIRGRPAPYVSFPYDNHCGVRCEDYVGSAEVSDCVIFNFNNSVNGDGNTRNHCGIQRYSHSTATTGLILRHNFISECFNGIFLKDEPATKPNTELIEWNYCYNNHNNIEAANVNPGATRSTIQHNFLIDGLTGLTGQQGEGNNQDMVYNTIVISSNSVGDGCIVGDNFGTNCTLNYNIMYNKGGRMMHDAGNRSFAPIIPSDRNCFYSATGFRSRFNGTDINNATGTTGLTSWISATGIDTNSIFSDPLFTDLAGYDFTLQGGSPCLTLGPGSTYVGAIDPADPRRPGPRYKT